MISLLEKMHSSENACHEDNKCDNHNIDHDNNVRVCSDWYENEIEGYADYCTGGEDNNELKQKLTCTLHFCGCEKKFPEQRGHAKKFLAIASFEEKE